MVYAPDSGRLRSLFARPFNRSRTTHDPLDRREPSFASPPPIPKRASAHAAPTADPEPIAPHANPPRAKPLAETRTRYGLPGARPSDVFGPYARSAEAELSAGVEEDEDDAIEPDHAKEDREATGGTGALDAEEGPDGLIDRLSRALSGIEPGQEKNSVALFPIVAPESLAPKAVTRPSASNRAIEVLEHDELFTDAGSKDFLEDDTAGRAKRLRPARKDA